MNLNNRLQIMQNNQNTIIDNIKKDNTYKQYFNDLKIQFSEILQAELIEAINQNKNIFDNEYKIFIINNVVEDFQKYSCSDNIETLKRFLKYKVDLKNFLFQKYYSIANQCRLMHKKSTEHEKQQNNSIDYKQRIAIEKWNLQRQKELLKIKQLEQKIENDKQKYNIKQVQVQQPRTTTRATTTKTIYKPVRSGNGGEVAKIFIYLMFAPFVIFGLIIYGFLGAAAKTK